MKILEFYARYENHDNPRIPKGDHDNLDNHRILYENQEHHEKL